MATKFKFEIESDGLTLSQTLAFRTFIGTLGGTEFLEQNRQEDTQPHLGTCLKDKITPDYAEGIKKDIVEAVENTKKKRASLAKAKEAQAKEVISETPMQIDARNMDVVEEAQAEEAQAEEAQAEEVQASAYSIQDVRDRVKEKQVKWRTSIKAELERLGSSSVSLLDPKHFEEFCNFMDNLA